MRIVVVADVHANLEALQMVLGQAERESSLDAVWCLGDLVGYGPDPGACIDLLRGLPLTAVAGNHDLAASGVTDTDGFNPIAAVAAEWTSEQLSQDQRDWLANLPREAREGEFTLVHGSLEDRVWHYLVSNTDAEEHLKLQETPYGFVGHSHLPLAFSQDRRRIKGVRPGDRDSVQVKDAKSVFNPGSVGQPRDGDRRAAFALLDTETRTIQFRRIEYDFAATQAKIAAARLPSFLGSRLSLGR